MIGTFGTLVFEASADRVRTFRDFKRNMAARFAAHEIINGRPLLQRVGTESQTVSFSMYFGSSLGVNPLAEVGLLKKMIEKGEAHKLFIGADYLGSFVIESASVTYDAVGSDGTLYAASAAVSLREYA